MKAYSEYWAATMMRGLLAVVAGTGVLFIPEMASTILLLPFAVAISVLCLAAYGTIDSAIILTTSFMIPRQQPGRTCSQDAGDLRSRDRNPVVRARVRPRRSSLVPLSRGGSGGHGSDHGVHRRKRDVGTPWREVVLRLSRCCRDLLDRSPVWHKLEPA